MSDNPQNQNEIGVIELLNYFKRGIKSVLRAIKNFFLSIGNLLLNFILMLKRNIIFVGVCILIFIGLWYYINHSPSMKNYGYELIVRPNYESTEVLYSNLSSLDFQKGSNKDPFLQNLLKVGIEPIEDMDNKIDAYYNALDNDYSSNNAFKQENYRDTVFFRQIEIKDFVESLGDKDFTTFKISLKSKKLLTKEEIYEHVIKPVEEAPAFQRMKTAYLKELDFEESSYKRSINLIDSLLVARVQPEMIEKQENFSLHYGAYNHKFVETEILEEKEKITNDLHAIALRKAINAEVVNVISDPKLVLPDRRVKRTLPAFLMYGLLFASITLLGIRFLKYLNRVDKKD